MKTSLALLSLAAILVATPVLANDDVDMTAKVRFYLQKIDTNHDGQISKAEHDSFGEKMFKDADTNSDNMISLPELTAEKQKEKEEWKNAEGMTNDNTKK